MARAYCQVCHCLDFVAPSFITAVVDVFGVLLISYGRNGGVVDGTKDVSALFCGHALLRRALCASRFGRRDGMIRMHDYMAILT